jgi:hypothetical protein
MPLASVVLEASKFFMYLRVSACMLDPPFRIRTAFQMKLATTASSSTETRVLNVHSRACASAVNTMSEVRSVDYNERTNERTEYKVGLFLSEASTSIF